jgi:ABC-type proline/glycine betaine transport system substrate-binding protein
MKHKFMARTFMCEMCKKVSDRKSENQRFCGSLRKKEGCSYKNDLEYQKIYRIKHQERYKALMKQWHKDNPNYNIEWALKNKDRVKTLRKKWIKKNPNYFKEWRKKNDKT